MLSEIIEKDSERERGYKGYFEKLKRDYIEFLRDVCLFQGLGARGRRAKPMWKLDFSYMFFKYPHDVDMENIVKFKEDLFVVTHQATP